MTLPRASASDIRAGPPPRPPGSANYAHRAGGGVPWLSHVGGSRPVIVVLFKPPPASHSAGGKPRPAARPQGGVPHPALRYTLVGQPPAPAVRNRVGGQDRRVPRSREQIGRASCRERV